MAQKESITGSTLARDFNGITEAQYLSWCRDNNFVVSLFKTFQQIGAEAKRFSSQRAAAALKKYVKKELKTAVKRFPKEKLIEEINTAGYEEVCKEIVQEYNTLNTPHMSAHPYVPGLSSLYLDVVMYLVKESDIFEKDKKYPGVISRVVRHQNDWIRPYSDWSPKSHNRDKQLSSFLRHMFALYDVPLFMDSAFLNNNYSAT